MANVPSISVLITYYRERELLTRCLQSLLEGTRAVHEILVYDDCSPEPAADYLPSSPLIRVIRGEKNRGPSAGRNVLLSAATADYVHFHDCDDWFAADWCAKVWQAIQSSGADVVYTEIDSYRHGQLFGKNVLEIAKVTEGMDLVSFSLSHALLPLSGTYRTAFLRRIGGYREELWQSEDFEFHARLAMAEPRVTVLNESLAFIEVRDQSRSQKQLEVWQWRLASLRLLFLDLAPKYYPAFVEALCKTGCRLYELGDSASARQAYDLALQLGAPRYTGRSFSFRWLARALGPLSAEWVGVQMRSLRGRR